MPIKPFKPLREINRPKARSEDQMKSVKRPRLWKVEATSPQQKQNLKAFSNSRLEDMAMCPTWGVVHLQKRYPTEARSMALECGEVMHQVFAAVRIWQLDKVQGLPKHAKVTGNRIFGELRWKMVWDHCLNQTDQRDQVLELCFAVLHSSRWKDEVSDPTRTMTNMELATIVYVDEQLPKMDNWPIYVADESDPQSLVGIEQVFDVVLTYDDNYEIRYIGTVDGLVKKESTGKYYVDENKTASRLSDGWRLSFDVKHQATGYCAISSAIFPFKVMRSRVQGLRIKPSNKGEDVYPLEPVERTEDAIQHWATWVREMVETYEKYKNDFEHATRFTHSCNRFFRPCSLLSFCSDTAEGRHLSFHEHMVSASLSPSERAVEEGI
jgi:hypothetical protein